MAAENGNRQRLGRDRSNVALSKVGTKYTVVWGCRQIDDRPIERRAMSSEPARRA
jgi:hypothetical protein